MAETSIGLESSSKQPPSQFFDIIVHPLNQGIRIPALFMRRYGNSLDLDSVFLKISDGIQWKVELQVINGETWLKKGFQKFGEFYFVKKYHLLVFKYEGDSRFRVSIFDISAAEIDYSFRFKPVKAEVSEHSRGEKRENGEQNDGISHGHRLRKRINHGDSGDQSCVLCKGSSDRFSHVSGKEKLRECERDFRSEYQYPFFACLLKSSSLFPPNEVCIPTAFYKDYFATIYLKKEGEMPLNFNLRLCGEKTMWPVLVYEWTRGGRICGTGWRRCAEENGLKVGEIWIFELDVEEKVFNLYQRS